MSRRVTVLPQGDGFGGDDAASLGIGILVPPAGFVLDLCTAGTGKDCITGDKVGGFWRWAGIIPWASELRKVGKALEVGADAAAQMKRLSPGEIKALKDSGIDPHDLKPNSRYDLFKDANGNIHVKPRDGSGPGEPTGIKVGGGG